MNKAGYLLGYTTMEMDWETVFTSVNSVVVYKDRSLDTIRDEQSFYLVTFGKVVNPNIHYTSDYIVFQDVESIIMSTEVVYIKGFLLLRRKKHLIKELVNSNCDNEFNRLSNELNLDNWKYEFYHKKFLFNKMQKLITKNTLPNLCDIKRDHPLIQAFMEFIRNCFKMVNKRVFSFIVVGDTKIGKSVCFKNCLIQPEYIEYHNSMLEFSKCFDENKKLFRLMDDINWNTVDIMTLKTILNRNVATVDVKYSYGIIYPMINIFLMNKEDYVIFQKKYVDIWSFISCNVAIYPNQPNDEVIEETAILYDVNKPLGNLIFDDILKVVDWKDEFDGQINNGTKSNIYECVKAKLLDLQPYVYDNKQFIDLTSFDISLLPNRQLIENEMLRRIKEIETVERYKEKVEKLEKKPKSVTRRSKRSSRSHNSSASRVNDKSCLEYYFNRDKKRSPSITEDSKTEYDDTSNTSFNDGFMDEDYDDDDFGDNNDMVGNDADFGDVDDKNSLMNDSFNC